LKLAGAVTRVEGIPSAPESFDAQIDVRFDGSEKRAAAIVPGMACTVKLVPYADRRALVVPAKAVFEEEMDEDSRYVFVAGKDGKPQKRPVVIGKKTDDKVEIIRGLAEQDEVLLERPKEPSAGAEPKKETPTKAAETPKAKEPAKKDSAPEAAKKSDPPKKKADKKESSKQDGAKK
jgi:hypothetical protein